MNKNNPSNKVDKFDMILFGASGDLARKKILPSLYRRFISGEMPKESTVVCTARSDFSQESFVEFAKEAIVASGKAKDKKIVEFVKCLTYIKLDITQSSEWSNLKKALSGHKIRLFYLSVSPDFFEVISSGLHEHGFVTKESRIIIEKPVGHDLKSAKVINSKLAKHFSEKQIYRIDHYLGKQTVQNLLTLRFANSFLEPIWNSLYIDNVQITVAESVGVQGRGGYYDTIGALRDMVQNHMIQLISLIAMEPPSSLKADAIRDEKLKVIQSLVPVPPTDTIKAQYEQSKKEKSYKQDVANDYSVTESFVAIKAYINNWRWSRVPFYLRTGKRLKQKSSVITITFKDKASIIFEKQQSNKLIINIQPNEGISMLTNIKDLNSRKKLHQMPIDLHFSDVQKKQKTQIIDAYEQLIMDVARGNQTLFMRADEVEAAWHWSDYILAAWSEDKTALHSYKIGSQGPKEAKKILEHSHEWEEIK